MISEEMVERACKVWAEECGKPLSELSERTLQKLAKNMNAALEAALTPPAGLVPSTGNVTSETFAYYLAESDNGWCKIPRRVAFDMAQSYAAQAARIAELEQDCDRFVEGKVLAEHRLVEEVEAERDELAGEISRTDEVIAGWVNRATAAEARVKELEEAAKEDAKQAAHSFQIALSVENDGRRAAEARVKRLEQALRETSCPRPCNHRPEDFTAGACFDADECGCGVRAALGEKADV